MIRSSKLFISSLLLVATSFGVGQGQETTVGCANPQYSLPVDNAVPISVDYVVTVDEDSPNGGLFTAEVTYKGIGWVALAFSPSGGMVGSLAVIGLPNDATSVGTYFLGGYSESQVILMDQQTLMDTSCMQNETHTVMKFSKYLQEEGEMASIDPFGNNHILVAAGSSNSLGYHAHRVALGLPDGLPLEVCEDEEEGEEEATTAGSTTLEQEIACADPQHSIPVDTVPISVDYVMTVDEDSPNGGLFTAEVTYEGIGWVALAFSNTGSMVGSLAVIGLPNDPAGGVGKYFLGGYSESQVTLTDQQTLMDTSCMQNETHTVMRFTKYLKEEGEDVSIDPFGNNLMLVAAGSSNALGYHAHRIALGLPDGLPLEVCEEGNTDATPTTTAPTSAPVPTSSPTNAPTQSPTTSSPTTFDATPAVVNCSEFQEYLEVDGVPITLEYVVNVDEESPTGGLFSARVTYEGQGYVAMGFSPEGRMIGSLGVLGLPDEDQVQKYNLGGYSVEAVTLAANQQQTLVNATIVQNDTHTVLSFSRHLQEEGEIVINPEGTNFILVAAGASNALGFHAHRASLGLAFQPCVEGSAVSDAMSSPAITTVEIDTKQSLFKAHGAIAALAWGILVPMAIANSLLRHLIPGQGVWFQMHRGLNMLALLLTIVSFALVVKAINDTSNGEPRHFQPRDGTLGKHHTIGFVIFILVILQSIGGILRPHVPPKGEKPSAVRIMWEYGHKGSGVLLLAMAWYQCHSGLVLYAQRFVQDQDYTQVFWGITGTIAAIGISGKIHGIMTAEPSVEDTSDKGVAASTNNGASEDDDNDIEAEDLEEGHEMDL